MLPPTCLYQANATAVKGSGHHWQIQCVINCIFRPKYKYIWIDIFFGKYKQEYIRYFFLAKIYSNIFRLILWGKYEYKYMWIKVIKQTHVLIYLCYQKWTNTNTNRDIWTDISVYKYDYKEVSCIKPYKLCI